MLYRSYPDLFDNFRNCGLNYIGAWGKPWKSETFAAFRKKAYENNFLITLVVPQYTGIKQEHIATGIDGKRISGPRRSLTLAMTGKDAPIAQTLERTRECAAAGVNVEFDDAGSIGKRYRRQDEIGTPFCITYDFDSETDGCVTIRDRDTMEQTRVPIESLSDFIKSKLEF